MKLLLSFFLAVCPLFQMVHAQGDTLVDVFPLAVGNQWTYRYYIWYGQNVLHFRAESDSGCATYTVVGRVASPDSTRWLFQRRRDLRHHLELGSQGDSTYAIRDTAAFEIIEQHTGGHQLYRTTLDLLDVFPFTSEHIDTTMILRYRKVTSGDSVRFLSRRRGWSGTRSLFTFVKQTGLLRYEHDLGFIDAWSNADHYLVHSIITSAGPARPLSAFSLSQNYPNPFNPLTTINVSVPSQANLTLKIYDVLGKEVKSFEYENVPAGTHQIVWDGKSNAGTQVASGVYFYRLTSGSTMLTKEMILLR